MEQSSWGTQPEFHRNSHFPAPNWPSDDCRRTFSNGRSHRNQNLNSPPPLLPRKRPFGPSDSLDTGGFVKLYVDGVPRSAEDDDIWSVFAEHGHIIEVVRLRDKTSGLRKECCFVKYRTLDEADRAKRAFNGRFTFPGGEMPLIIRYADGERERLGSCGELSKLYVSGLSKQVSKRDIDHMFSPYGIVEDIYVMLGEHKQSLGKAFVSFAYRDMAIAAINALHGAEIMQVCDRPLIVRFADPKKPKVGELRAPSHMNEQFTGNMASNQSNHQSPNQTPNNRSNPQTVSSNYVGSNNILPSPASSVNARSLNTEMVESIDCEWSEHICPDGYLYYYNCMTCESRWEKPEEFALHERKLEKLDLQQQDQHNLKLEVCTTSEVYPMPQDLEIRNSTVPLACV